MSEFDLSKISKLPERMNHTINGPTRPALPQVSPFMVEDAEAEIRRNVQRHYEMKAEIATLTTDRDHWRHRAELAEAEIVRQAQTIQDLEQQKAEQREGMTAEIDELKVTITALETEFDNSAQIILRGYERLKARQPKLVTPTLALERLKRPDSFEAISEKIRED